MIISMIAAMDRFRTIGYQGKIPWYIPADMAHFVRTTMGKPILMGRKTFESLGCALPGRHNIVVTRDPEYLAAGATVISGLEHAKEAAGDAEELIVIGGALIYKQMLPFASKLYLTHVDIEVQRGDAKFPPWYPKLWDEVSRVHPIQRQQTPGPPCVIVTLERAKTEPLRILASRERKPLLS